MNTNTLVGKWIVYNYGYVIIVYHVVELLYGSPYAYVRYERVYDTTDIKNLKHSGIIGYGCLACGTVHDEDTVYQELEQCRQRVKEYLENSQQQYVRNKEKQEKEEQEQKQEQKQIKPWWARYFPGV